MISAPEAAADQLGHPGRRPQVGAEAVGGGLLGQPAEDLGLLRRGQEGRPAGVWLGLQPFVASGAVGADPLVDGDRVDAQEGGHVGLRPALADTLDGQAPAGFLASGRLGVIHDAKRVNIPPPNHATPTTCGSVGGGYLSSPDGIANSIVSNPADLFAWSMAQRNVPSEPSSSALMTVNLAGVTRGSNSFKLRTCRKRFTIPLPLVRFRI